MNRITKALLGLVSDWKGGFNGAYNIRENGQCAERQSTKNIKIETREDGQGLVIQISPEAKKETVYIPACVTHGNIEDLAYNDFFIGAGADVAIIAGCGVHSDGEGEAGHNGIHRFFLEKGAHATYTEKHVGTGKGTGLKKINPVTDIVLGEDAVLEMETVQIGGVDSTIRKTKAVLAARSRLIIHERILTQGDERAQTDFDVKLEGDGCAVDLVSRSVARGSSYQEYRSKIEGSCRCAGHSACDAILAENGRVNAAPELLAASTEASLIHEAAIGKIAGEQITKLRTLGLTEEEAESKIIDGFLKG